MSARLEITVTDLDTKATSTETLRPGEHSVYLTDPLVVTSYVAFPDGSVQITMRPEHAVDLPVEDVPDPGRLLS